MYSPNIIGVYPRFGSFFSGYFFYCNQYGHRENNCNMLKRKSNFVYKTPFVMLNHITCSSCNKVGHIDKFCRLKLNEEILSE